MGTERSVNRGSRYYFRRKARKRQACRRTAADCRKSARRSDEGRAGGDEVHSDFRRTEELAEGCDRQRAWKSQGWAEPDGHRGPDGRRRAGDDWCEARRAGGQAPSAARPTGGRPQASHRRREAADAVSRGAEAVAAPYKPSLNGRRIRCLGIRPTVGRTCSDCCVPHPRHIKGTHSLGICAMPSLLERPRSLRHEVR